MVEFITTTKKNNRVVCRDGWLQERNVCVCVRACPFCRVRAGFKSSLSVAPEKN